MIYPNFEQRAKESGGEGGFRFCVEAHDQSAQATCARCGMRETAYRMFEVDRIVEREG